MARTLFPLLIALLLAGCGQRQVSYSPASIALADSGRVKQALQQHYQQWRGVPYRIGGTTEDGVDCSAFTQLTYSRLFGVNPGRSTEDQLARGRSVSRGALRPGDLVFFRTGKGKHVGIYFDDGWFVHASASKGVTASTLNRSYWDRNFYTARRY